MSAGVMTDTAARAAIAGRRQQLEGVVREIQGLKRSKKHYNRKANEAIRAAAYMAERLIAEIDSLEGGEPVDLFDHLADTVAEQLEGVEGVESVTVTKAPREVPS
jgi:hypothetical protein